MVDVRAQRLYAIETLGRFLGKLAMMEWKDTSHEDRLRLLAEMQQIRREYLSITEEKIA